MSKFTRQAKPPRPEGEAAPDAKGEAPPAGSPEGAPPGPAAGDPAPPDAAAAGVPPDAASAAPLSPEKQRELVQKAEERDLYRNELLRSRADFDNYQKRAQRERVQVQEQAVRRLVLDLLPVLDNFDRALGGEDATVESIREGIRIVQQMLQKALQDHGIVEIEALGKPFDPLLHDAVVHEETTAFPPDTVSEVLQKGYTHRGAVARAAQVKVARAPAAAGPPPGPGQGGAAKDREAK